MDFYDKLITAIICVIVTFICVFNTFCFAESYDTVITPTYLFNASLTYPNSQFGQVCTITDSNDYFVFYSIPSYYGCNYHFTIDFSDYPSTNPTFFRLFECSEFPQVGSQLKVLDYFEINQGDILDFDYYLSVDKQLYLCLSSNGTGNQYVWDHINITTDYLPNGFNDVVNSLVENVGISSIWETFETSLPYVCLVVLAGFGFYLIFHNIKELSKGREKMN